MKPYSSTCLRELRSVFLAGAILLPAGGMVEAAVSEVRIWEDTVSIPTYQTSAPDTAPLFYDGRGYQGAKGPIYPYPIIDRLPGIKTDKSYQRVCLENEYIQLCVLPELGGRIFTGLDKTNGYPFFYQQHVIKPALIGMTGAWISGGVEWNIPHHHRASSFMPVNYRMEENADGSKTIWVGEMELRHRMRWVVSLTLHPGRSYVDTTVKLRNETPISNTFLYFANVAVHANDNYQVIFPPSTRVATQHAKVEFSRWPIANGPYGGVDFSRGVDVSWYKNHPSPTSMFAFDCKEDFLAGYDHGRHAGTLHIADHGVMPGKKFFTWGVGQDGQVWDRLLTDTDGPYLELMVGGYSDNQPDYSWIQPYETKVVHEYWYPYREIGGVKNANTEAAVNLEMINAGRARVGLYATADHPSARITLRTQDRVLLEKTAAIGPAKPFVAEVAVPSGVQEQDLRATLEADGRTLVAYQAKLVPEARMPLPVVPPPPPKQVKTNEELYQAGIRLQQFYSPAAEPDPYLEEAIRRDPGDFRANTALGILYYRRGMFNQAEERLAAAAGRASFNYTSPKDGEAFYYLGLAEKAQGKDEAAWEAFYKATWSWAWHAPAYYGLAELSCRKGDFARALAFLDDSLGANAVNGKALNLKSALLRKSGRENEAAAAASAAMALDPLDQRSRREWRLAKGLDPAPVRITGGVNDDVQPYLEMAVDYSSAGLWDEGIAALSDLVNGYADKNRVHAMAYYWLGWLSERRGNASDAAHWRQLASRMPTDYVFPFRLESIEVLRRAMAANPSDARAPYYLGSLLYDLQPAEALHAWEKAAALDGNFALLQRNLALAYSRFAHDHQKAKASMEKAVALKPEPRFLVERDELYEAAGVPVSERFAALEKLGPKVRERDDAMGRLIGLSVQLGDYDQALELLSSRRFNVWEGGEDALHDSWVNAHLLRGDAHFHAGRFPQALKDYQAALDYPENLAVGRPLDGGRSPVAYLAIAETQKQLGNQAAAKSALEQSVAESGARTRYAAWSDESAETAWYRARAFEMLGNRTEAAQVYDMLVRSGQSSLSESAEVDYFAKFAGQTGSARHLAHAHYVLALGYLGQGKTAEAKSEFETALRYDTNHIGAKRQLAWMDNPVRTARR